MTIKISTKSQNIKTHTATLNENQIKKALAEVVALEARVGLDSEAVTVRVVLLTRDQTGTAGIEKYAEVTITEDLDKYPKAEEYREA
ncbi:MAG: hypothetical protein ABGX82_14395 [Pseudomonas sp.]|uniref:hypothetical protein n=1 Tax=Pseudomonas sp. TaxID=306 RepID=UPI0032427505